jgi:hypothetical protein
MTTKYNKWLLNKANGHEVGIVNGHKICEKLDYKAFQNIPKLEGLV